MIDLRSTLALYTDDKQRPTADYNRPGDVIEFPWYTKMLVAVVVPWRYDFLGSHVGSLHVASEMGWTHEIPVGTWFTTLSRPADDSTRTRNVEIAHMAVVAHYREAAVWATTLDSTPGYRFFPEYRKGGK